MESIIADYSGLILVLFINFLIAGPVIFFFIRDHRKLMRNRKQSVKKVVERLRLAFSFCGVSFLILSLLSTFFYDKYLWENIVWGFFCGLALLWLDTFTDAPQRGG